MSNAVIDGSSTTPQLSVEISYRGISNHHNNQTFLTKSAMNELRTHLSFTQLRFYCSKQQGRTFHVATVANSTGEAVVQYFSGQTDVPPASCGSFVRIILILITPYQWEFAASGGGLVNGVMLWMKAECTIMLYMYHTYIIGC